MRAQLANNAATTLASTLSNVAGTATVAAGTGNLFPATGYFYATLLDASNVPEIVKCTSRSTDVLTITRAQEGTAARTFAAGSRISLNITAAVLNELAPLDNPVFTGTTEQDAIINHGDTLNNGAAKRHKADFSHSTVANRYMYQTTTLNGATAVHAIPNGTSQIASWSANNAADPTNSGEAKIQISATEMSILSTKQGTGAYVPMSFYTSGVSRLTIATDGAVSIPGATTFGAAVTLGATAAAKDATLLAASTAFVDRLRSLLPGETAGTGTLVVADRGSRVVATGDITVPQNIFAANDVVTIYNNTAANINLVQGTGVTLRKAGTATTGTLVIPQRGLVTVVFNSATDVTASGNIN